MNGINEKLNALRERISRADSCVDGTGLGGTAALMTMLNACAPGIAVVNIDNGFGAGYMAHLINTRMKSEPPAVAGS